MLGTLSVGRDGIRPGHRRRPARVVAAVVGAENVDTDPAPMTGSKDFAFMLEKVPGAVFFAGRSEGANVHNPGYNLNDDIIPIGASCWRALPS